MGIMKENMNSSYKLTRIRETLSNYWLLGLPEDGTVRELRLLLGVKSEEDIASLTNTKTTSAEKLKYVDFFVNINDKYLKDRLYRRTFIADNEKMCDAEILEWVRKVLFT